MVESTRCACGHTLSQIDEKCPETGLLELSSEHLTNSTKRSLPHGEDPAQGAGMDHEIEIENIENAVAAVQHCSIYKRLDNK